MRKVIVFMAVLLCGVTSVAYAQEGRWKLGGDGSCYWDASDGGPNQCDPTPAEVPVEPAVSDEEVDTANRLAAAAETLESWGINQDNVQPYDLPWILVALENQGFTFDVTSAEAFRLVSERQYDRYAGPENCEVVQRKMARLKDMNRAFTEAAWLWGAGGGILSRIGASPPVISVVAVGAAVSAMAATVTSWMIQDYQNAPCVT